MPAHLHAIVRARVTQRYAVHSEIEVKSATARTFCTALLAWASLSTTQAAPFLQVGNDQYDEIIDRATTIVGLYGQETKIDCAKPPVITHTANNFRVTVLLAAPDGVTTPCDYNRTVAPLGTLARGDYVVRFDIIGSGGDVVATAEREFHVRPYVGSCNRYPKSGSVVNVFSATLNGTGIAELLAANPAITDSLGNPTVSLTWYNNAGAQLVYPTPIDPVPWQDRALATGLFRNVGMMRGNYCSFTIPPPDVESPVIEYRNADLETYFYATDSGEIASLDSGTAWKRTGKQFRAITSACNERKELFSAYRFFGKPGVGPTSHVFTIDQEECYAVNQSGGWVFEGTVFYAERPLRDGACEVATHKALYRVWRPFGESRHRFTTDRTVVAEHVAKGWIDEGPVMCVVN